MPPEPTFTWSINTMVSGEDSSPWVQLSIWYHIEEGDAQKLIGTWQWSPDEARNRGRTILAAAEAAESDADVIMVLRSRKFPEEEIEQIMSDLRSHRVRGQ